MAAAYTTGISSSPTTLLTTLVSWLSTQGWTVDSSASDGAGWRAHLHKSGLYVNLRAANNENIWPYTPVPPGDGYHDLGFGGYGIGLYLGDGYSGAASWDMQSGRPVRVDDDGSTIGCGANLPSGSVAAYHFFDDGNDHIIVVVERAPGIFCHFGWGPALEAAGQPEDFPYFYGSSAAVLNTLSTAPEGDRGGINISAYPPMCPGDKEVSSDTGAVERVHTTAMVRVDVATFSGRWVANCDPINTGGYGGSGRGMACSVRVGPSPNYSGHVNYANLRDRIHQTSFAGALLLPCHTFVLTDPAARWAPLGYPPSIFWTEAVGHGYGPGEIYQLGSVNYMLFPHFAVFKGA